MALSGRVAVVVLTASAGGLARRIASALGDAEVHGLQGRVADADQFYTETMPHLRGLFASGRPVVGICAAGILIRALAPILGDKRAEPPVVAVSDDGAFAVPLLGGHRGGIELARRIAGIIGAAAAAVTTAGDSRFGIALDQPPEGWTLASPQDYKPFAAALLEGARVRLRTGDQPDDTSTESSPSALDRWLAASRLPFDEAGALTIRIGDGIAEGAPDTLIYRPRRLAVGIGCERGTAPDEVSALARACLDSAGLAPEAVAGVFSIDLKSDEPALHAVAEALGVPARFFDAAALEAEAGRLCNPSDLVFREVGCHGVAGGRGACRGRTARRSRRREDEVDACDLRDRAGAGAHRRRIGRIAPGGAARRRYRTGRCRHRHAAGAHRD